MTMKPNNQIVETPEGGGSPQPPLDELPPIATRGEVSAFTRISAPTLARWASEMPPRGPKYRKAGGRVIYHRGDVLAWLDSLEVGGAA